MLVAPSHHARYGALYIVCTREKGGKVSTMRFSDILAQAKALLQREGRLTYRSLKREFALEDEALEDLKFELIEGQELAIDKDGKMLVWKGTTAAHDAEDQKSAETAPRYASSRADSQPDGRKDSSRTEAERRQLTVMFCDLVGSTALSERLDPEEYHEVVSRYQETCTAVIKRYAGHIAQHLGDGLLAYFGYPVAHEDDAQRAVRTGLEILAELSSLNARLPSAMKAQLPHPLQVRIGVHTGVVVIGEIGSNEKREILAMGETPNIAVRVQGLAEPDTLVMSAVTRRLVQGLFECQDLGVQTLKGISTPLSLYRVIGESVAQSRFEAAVQRGLTPLVGREAELGMLRQRWDQAKAGGGQVILLSGEPGIGKSRLVQELKEQVSAEGATRIEFRCSPYHQNSALYPIIDHLQRLLQFARDDSLTTKLEKLQHTLSRYRFPQAETLPFLAALLSLPHPEGFSPITVSPQKQKEKTQAALVAWLIEEAEQAAVLCVWEDLHWADPSTLEVLTLLLDQVPMVRLLVVLTFRPEFISPWGNRSHLSQLTVSRLERPQVEAMVEKVTGEKALPPEVVQQIADKTDGVPLFVEELTKSVIESGGVKDVSPLRFSIPVTIQDSLMARLDRLNTAKELAQLGATIGREFSYELLHAVAPLDDDSLQQRLRQLVEAELLYQFGLPPQVTYLFKHALIRDTAYQSLPKSKRQQLHRQIAQVLEGRFAETVETQPELIAHHYTEAGLAEQAILYWQKAGQRAIQSSANLEAVSHLTKGLDVLKTLPDTPERTQQELTLQIALGVPLIATSGYASPEVEHTYARARDLCRQVGVTPQLFPVLWGLWVTYFVRGDLQIARELGEQLFSLACTVQNPALLLEAHLALGLTAVSLGELPVARSHLEQGISLYDPQQHNSHAFVYGQDPGVVCLSWVSWVAWVLGYPDQALQKTHAALARALAHPFSLAYALGCAGVLYQLRRESVPLRTQAEETGALAREQGFAHWEAVSIVLRGGVLANEDRGVESIVEIGKGLIAWQTTGAGTLRPYALALLAEAYGKAGQASEGLTTLTAALALVENSGECWHEAELYRLKGELTLQKGARDLGLGTRPASPPTLSLKPQDPREVEREAEACFLKAIAIAQKQQAKSWELRAATSLARLWQQQGKKAEARQMLAEIYGWFTEGFDTKDLQEAKELVEELS